MAPVARPTDTPLHRVVEDLLAAPGTTDITAGVDFGFLAETRRRTDCEPSQPSQHDALIALGFEHWLHTELERQQDLLDSGRGADAGAHVGRPKRLLADPAGLGVSDGSWLPPRRRRTGVPAWLVERRSAAEA